MATDKSQQQRDEKANQLWEDLAEVAKDLKELATKAPEVQASKRKEFQEKLTSSQDEYQKRVAKDASEMRPALEQLKKQVAAARKYLPDEDDSFDADTATKYEKLQRFFDRTSNEEGVFSFRKAMLQAIGLLGEREQKESGATPKAATRLQATRSYQFANKLVKSVDSVAKSVKLVGGESLKWIGKKIKDLSFLLWRFITKPIEWLGKGAGLLGTLIPLAMLVPYVKEALKTIDKTLREKYGDDYVKTILKKLWDQGLEQAQKGWEWLKEVAGKVGAVVAEQVQDLWDKFSKAMAESWTNVQKWIGEKFDIVSDVITRVADFLLPKPLKTAPVGNQYGATKADATGKQVAVSVGETVEKKLNLYLQQKRGPQKVAAKTNLQNDLNGEEVTPHSLSIELVQKLHGAGFKVPKDKIANTPPTAATPSPTPEATPTAATPSPTPEATPTAATPNTQPSENKPVTAAPNAVPQETSGNTQPSQMGTKVSGGLPLSGIPTHAGDDSLSLINSGMWGVA